MSDSSGAWRLPLADEAATTRLGQLLGRARPSQPAVLGLRGPLGAGKSALARAMLRELGVCGAIRSPTYALIEPYEVRAEKFLHIDLYRLESPAEVEFLGLDEALAGASLAAIEWPERAGPARLPIDLDIALAYAEPGRLARLQPLTTRGQAWLAGLSADRAFSHR